MSKSIKKVAVIGAGVMGASIAGHLANAGISSYLFDIVPNDLTPEEAKKGLTLNDPEVRNRFAVKGREKLLKASPSPLFTKKEKELITSVNLEDDLHHLSEVDWVCECVMENLEIKRGLFEKIAPYIKHGAIISTNSSGLSIEAICESMPLELRKNFLGVHFFNPPRYMKLLEIIPTKDTLPEIVQSMVRFGERVLGKGVVLCKETPNFIANRIGVYALAHACKIMEEENLTIDEMDNLTGTVIGRPKSATFRLLDIVGIDTYVHILDNIQARVSDSEKELFAVPTWLREMVKKGYLGDKSGLGFYKRVKGSDPLTLDIKTMEYQPKQIVDFASISAVDKVKDPSVKFDAILSNNDKPSNVVWKILKGIMVYSAELLMEIADDIVAMDNATKWGFNWDIGPFEIWDAIGIEKAVVLLQKEGQPVPAVVKNLLASGKKTFYKYEKGESFYYDYKSGEYKVVQQPYGVIVLKSLKEREKTVYANKGGSLIDLDDGVLFLEIKSDKQAINFDVMELFEAGVQEMNKNYKGMVIGSQTANFCLGANINMILSLAKDGKWNELEQVVKRFQDTNMSIKYSSKPVVAAPYGLTLGGGAEVCLHSDRVRAAGELYMGLVEPGIGLIPGGGGNKEVLIRNMDEMGGDKCDLYPIIKRSFDAISMVKISTSARDAQQIGYLRGNDRITMGLDQLVFDAKQTVLAMDLENYTTPRPRKIRVAGESGVAYLKMYLWSMYKGGFISEHDMKVGNKIAWVLCGGNVSRNTLVDEQYLLDVEREAFLSLCGEPKTQERMEYMLAKGKPLRN